MGHSFFELSKRGSMETVVKFTNAKVNRIIDGDTVELLLPVTVRIKGIQAPELPTKEGEASRIFLVRQIFGKDVDCELQGKDIYGRQLGSILYQDSQNTVLDVGTIMIESGMARIWEERKTVEIDPLNYEIP